MIELRNVFPTGVGVNRHRHIQIFQRRRFPHRRGGEPEFALQAGVNYHVFPTGVGVNRDRRQLV